ncbi:uncharacterized protein LOC124368644 [Homalodisca vitripennis]|uniref:uncharacterized protein LOC124368644 n=1 Tax=Homalodisca vitripennis TaxID=197043 RepID=UPI001EEA40DE|nr:uncharacterized protein LOC124368644 [Homalodisca vitripennis]
MVQHSEYTDVRSNESQAPIDKMASQLESCLPHISSMYTGLKVQKKPPVHCQVSQDCQWVGDYEDTLSHCQQVHPDKIWLSGEKERCFTVEDISKDSYHVELVVAHGRLFWLHVKTDLFSNHLYAACQHIERGDEDSHTKYMIRTELCDETRLNCISSSYETRPSSEDITKIFTNQRCPVRSLQRLNSFTNSDKSLTLHVSINKVYYYQ